jgi:hypothetical protein
MKTLYELLEAELPAEPPLTVDVTTAIVRGRRSAQRRRVALVAACTGLLIAVGGITVSVGPGGSGRNWTADPGNSVVGPALSSGVPSPWASVGSPIPNRLDSVIQETLHRLMPDVTVAPMWSNDVTACQLFQNSPPPGRTAKPTCDVGNYHAYTLSHGDQAGSLHVAVHPDDGTGFTSCNNVAGEPIEGCHDRMDGNVRIIDLTTAVNEPYGPVYEIAVIRPGVMVVEVELAGAPTDSSYTAFRDPPIGADQLADFAKDPALVS